MENKNIKIIKEFNTKKWDSMSYIIEKNGQLFLATWIDRMDTKEISNEYALYKIDKVPTSVEELYEMSENEDYEEIDDVIILEI